jgi:hypothetical protein
MVRQTMQYSQIQLTFKIMQCYLRIASGNLNLDPDEISQIVNFGSTERIDSRRGTMMR